MQASRGDSIMWNKFGTDKQKRECVKEYLLANPDTKWRLKLKSYFPIDWVEPSSPKRRCLALEFMANSEPLWNVVATLTRHSVNLNILSTIVR